MKSTQNTLVLFLSSLVSVAVFMLIAHPGNTAAAYDGGNIIDNGIFLNSNSMDINGIQSFLASKGSGLTNRNFVLNCYGQNSQERQWYSAVGAPCDQFVPASHIIYYASKIYGINPQVVLATMQKEQSLITSPNPTDRQIAQAMGYNCPTTGECDGNSSFFYQIDSGAWVLRYHYERANGNMNWWKPSTSWTCGVPTQFYKPSLYPGQNVNFYDGSGIHYRTHFITNAATSSFYCYTPHAYNNPQGLYGRAPYGTTGQYYSGSYNFVTSFESWFGSTTNSSLYYSIIQGPNSPALYLQTSAGKYYIPSGEIMAEWGLQNLPVSQVSQTYIDSLPTGDWLYRVLKDDWGNMFVVEGGKLHYVRDYSYFKLWNLDPGTAVQSLGLTRNIPSSTWLGRFMQDSSSSTGQIWLIDNGTKRAITNPDLLYQWGYTPDQFTSVGKTYLDSMPTGGEVSRYIKVNSSDYLIDAGRKLNLSNQNLKSAYFGNNIVSSFNEHTLTYLPTHNVSQFIVNASTGHWYMLENGTYHYIPSSNLADIWGKNPNQYPIPVSNGYFSSLNGGDNLAYVVQTANPSAYWLLDGKKHYIPDSDTAEAWLTTGSSPPLYSNESLSHITQGNNASVKVKAQGSPYIYIMDRGMKRYLSSNNAVNAWGGDYQEVSRQLIDSIPEGSFIDYKVKDKSGRAYLMMDSVVREIDNDHFGMWGINNTTPIVSDETVSRYPKAADKLKAFVKIGSTIYVMNDGRLSSLNKHSDAYNASSLHAITLPSSYFNTTVEASYLIRSSNPSDQRVWLITNGKKMLLTFEFQVSYGYLSRGVNITQLAQSTIDSIPDDNRKPSLLLQKSGSGIKLINFGYSLGFPDGDTLLSYIGDSNEILEVSSSIFDSFELRRDASRLIRDDRGNLFWMENGKKRYILNGAILSRYPSKPQSYLEGTTMYLLPSGDMATGY